MKRLLLLALVLSLGSPALAGGPCGPEYASLALRQSSDLAHLQSLATTEAKEKFIVDAFGIGDTSYIKTDSLARKIKEMPQEEKDSWISSIGRVYRTVPKKNPSPTARRHIGGRRLLDRLVSMVRDPSQRFAEGDPTQVFHAFLDEQSKIYGTGYGGNEVLLAAKQLQDYLKGLPAAGGPQPEFFMGGSFLNGKAKLKGSDLDVTAKNMSAIMRDVPELKKKVNESLAARGVESDLDVEPHSVEPEFYGQINPLVLHITPDHISVMVYKPGYTVSDELIRTEAPAEYVLHP